MFLELIALLDVALWLYLLLAHGQFWRLIALKQDTPLPEVWPEVCVIIPARNEADMLDGTLASVLMSDYPQLHVLLVDDHSEDGTVHAARRIAKQCGAEDHLTLVSGRPLPGFKGKVAAMQSGLDYLTVSARTPRYVLFTDADVAYDRHMLKSLVAHAETGNYVLTSLMVRLRCKSIAERWLIPAFVYFFQLLYPFRRINNPSRKTAGAAGGCMLVRYEALAKTEGLWPIRHALIDDCALGKLLKQQGPIWLGLTQDVRSVRAYPKVRDIGAMVARTAYDQLGYSPLMLALSLLGLALAFLAPVAVAVTAEGIVQWLALVSWILMCLTYVPLLRFYRRPVFTSVLLPVVALFYMGFTVASACQYWRGRGGMWKGRMQATGFSR